MINQEYIVVDLETTGFDPRSGHEIIEIGVTEIKEGKTGLNYSRLIKPRGIIPTNITRLTKIDNEMVKNEKEIEDVLPKFREYIGDKTIIAHNASFDLKFLNYYLEKMELEPISNYICTLELLRKLKSMKRYFGAGNKLHQACEYYNIELIGAHRAKADTLATAELFLIIQEELMK